MVVFKVSRDSDSVLEEMLIPVNQMSEGFDAIILTLEKLEKVYWDSVRNPPNGATKKFMKLMHHIGGSIQNAQDEIKEGQSAIGSSYIASDD